MRAGNAWNAGLRPRDRTISVLRSEIFALLSTANLTRASSIGAVSRKRSFIPSYHDVFASSSSKEIVDANAKNLIHRRGANYFNQLYARSFASKASNQEKQHESRNQAKKEISTIEDPFDSPTYNIPEKPVTFAEGASYSVVILAGLGIAAAAGYAVFKELIFEPKEYKVFNKALKRIQDDSQVRVRIGSPITGYGQESRNRAARQRIANKIFTDEDGIEHVQIGFYIRGPHGAGKVAAEMFKDKVDKQWKYTYLIVQITQPSQAQLILESYIPAANPVPA